MLNANVETALKALTETVSGNPMQEELFEGTKAVVTELSAYNGGLKRQVSKSVEYDVGATYSSFESRWKYQLLKGIVESAGGQFELTNKYGRTVKLTGDPYTLQVATKAFEAVREALRRDTRRNLQMARKNGQVENSFAWYTEYRQKVVTNLVRQLHGEAEPEPGTPPTEPPKAEVQRPMTVTAERGGAPPSRAHLVVEVGGRIFDLVPRE